jgi:hypothetical protein
VYLLILVSSVNHSGNGYSNEKIGLFHTGDPDLADVKQPDENTFSDMAS